MLRGRPPRGSVQLRHYRDRHVTFWRGAAEGSQGAAAVTLLVDGAPGGPMHHELLSTTACALALLQPSNTRPVSPARTLRCSGGVLFLHTAKICNCHLCFARRWDMRRQIHSLWWTTPSPCARYFPSRPALQRWMCCLFAPHEGMCCWGWLPAVRARSYSCQWLVLSVHGMD